MPIRKRSTDLVRDARKAHQDAAGFDRQADQVEAEVQRLEAESVDILINDPNQAGDVNRRIDAQDRLVRAYRTKANNKRADVEDLKRDALAREATELEKEGDRLARDAERHEARVDDLLAQLRELNGIKYIRESDGDLRDGEDFRVVEKSVGDKIQEEAGQRQLQARVNRFYLTHGQPPTHSVQLLTEEGSLEIPHNYIPGTWPLDQETSRSDLMKRVLADTWLDEDNAA